MESGMLPDGRKKRETSAMKEKVYIYIYIYIHQYKGPNLVTLCKKFIVNYV